MLPTYSTWKLGLLTLITVLLLALLLLATPSLKAAGLSQSGSQIFNSNLTVSADQTYEGDVTVTNGNVLVEDNGTIDGNLVVWSGNVEIQDGGEVGGDVSAFSGNIKIAGKVDGRVAALSGNIELEETAVVDGDVSVMSGKILRSRGAEIGGNVIEGPSFVMPKPFQGWAAPDAPQPPPVVTQTRSTFGERLGWLIMRLLLAVIVTAVVVVLCVALFNLRPDLLQPLRTVLLEQTAFSFVVGLIVNLVLFFTTSLLIGTVCLALFAAAPALALLGLNLFGWTVVAQIVGERVSQYIKRPIRPLANVALGALLLTGVVALLLALGECLRPVAFLLWLLPASGGVGAALVHWLKLGKPVEPSSPVSPSPAPVAAAPTMSTPPVTQPPVEPPVAVQGEIPPASPTPEEAVPAVAALADMPSVAKFTPADTPASADDDFTVINGIGLTFDRRLKAAGIHTFAQLAGMTPDQIGAIIGWTSQRVVADDLVGQAGVLAERR